MMMCLRWMKWKVFPSAIQPGQIRRALVASSMRSCTTDCICARAHARTCGTSLHGTAVRIARAAAQQNHYHEQLGCQKGRAVCVLCVYLLGCRKNNDVVFCHKHLIFARNINSKQC